MRATDILLNMLIFISIIAIVIYLMIKIIDFILHVRINNKILSRDINKILVTETSYFGSEMTFSSIINTKKELIKYLKTLTIDGKRVLFDDLMDNNLKLKYYDINHNIQFPNTSFNIVYYSKECQLEILKIRKNIRKNIINNILY